MQRTPLIADISTSEKIAQDSGGVFKVTCLGGTGEIGMNMFLYETAVDAVMVDSGIMFADRLHCGVDYIYSGTAYVEKVKNKLRAVLYTHGHEDHVGAAVNTAENFGVPVYASAFTSEILSHRFAEAGINGVELMTVQPGEDYTFGTITVSFFPVPHSIPDTMGIYVKTEYLDCIHLSDFSSGDGVDFPDAGLLLLDSTGAKDSGEQAHTEADVALELLDIFKQTPGNVIFTTFSSNVARMKTAIDAARQTGRKIVVEGSSMQRTFAIAVRRGLIRVDEGELYSVRDAHRKKEQRYLYIVGGCQGEPTSSMYPIATGNRKAVKIGRGDTVIFSARIIPGNMNVNHLVNSALKLGADVIVNTDRLVHVSGHANSRELAKVITRIRPQYFMPVHGEYMHLAANKKIALSCGVDPARVLLAETGEQLIFHKGKFVSVEKVDFCRYYYDERGGFTLTEEDVARRRQMAADGVVAVRCADGTVYLDTYGFDLPEGDLQELKDLVAELLLKEDNKETVTKTVKKFFNRRYRRRPLIDVKIEEEL